MRVSALSIKRELLPLTDRNIAICMRCSGQYQSGSNGIADARYIHAVAYSLLEETNASGLLLDYTDLAYDWGEALWATLQFRHRDSETDLAFAVVVGPKCEKGIKSLLEKVGGFENWLDAGYVFHSELAAVDHLRSAAMRGRRAR